MHVERGEQSRPATVQHGAPRRRGVAAVPACLPARAARPPACVRPTPPEIAVVACHDRGRADGRAGGRQSGQARLAHLRVTPRWACAGMYACRPLARRPACACIQGCAAARLAWRAAGCLHPSRQDRCLLPPWRGRRLGPCCPAAARSLAMSMTCAARPTHAANSRKRAERRRAVWWQAAQPLSSLLSLDPRGHHTCNKHMWGRSPRLRPTSSMRPSSVRMAYLYVKLRRGSRRSGDTRGGGAGVEGAKGRGGEGRTWRGQPRQGTKQQRAGGPARGGEAAGQDHHHAADGQWLAAHTTCIRQGHCNRLLDLVRPLHTRPKAPCAKPHARARMHTHTSKQAHLNPVYGTRISASQYGVLVSGGEAAGRGSEGRAWKARRRRRRR